MLNPPEVEQRADLDRERRLYDESREVIKLAKEMKDFDKHHRGEVSLPPEASGDAANDKTTFLDAMRARDENARVLREGREAVAAAAARASAAEEGVRAMATALEKRGRSMGFDERVSAKVALVCSSELNG